MLKQFVIIVFISLFSLTSVLAIAETANSEFKIRAIALDLNQTEIKYTDRPTNNKDNGEIVGDVNSVKTENAIVKHKTNNSEQTGWLLAFALFGFVMLSNRRGV